MTKIDPMDFVDKSTVQIKYVDSEGWTVPMILTEKRLEEIRTDLSIGKIIITTSDAIIYELDLI